MPRVLIVEDEPDVLGFMDVLLSTSGYETCTATNGVEALACMRERLPCVVLLDLMMPVMSGFEFRAHQLADPQLSKVPVVCVTAVYDPDSVAQRLNLKCLRKPVEFPEVLREVSAACGPGMPARRA